MQAKYNHVMRGYRVYRTNTATHGDTAILVKNEIMHKSYRNWLIRQPLPLLSAEVARVSPWYQYTSQRRNYTNLVDTNLVRLLGLNDHVIIAKDTNAQHTTWHLLVAIILALIYSNQYNINCAFYCPDNYIRINPIRGGIQVMITPLNWQLSKT